MKNIYSVMVLISFSALSQVGYNPRPFSGEVEYRTELTGFFPIELISNNIFYVFKYYYSGPAAMVNYYDYLEGSAPINCTVDLADKPLFYDVHGYTRSIVAYIDSNSSCPDYGKPCSYNHPNLYPDWATEFMAIIKYKKQIKYTCTDPIFGTVKEIYKIVETNKTFTKKYYNSAEY